MQNPKPGDGTMRSARGEPNPSMSLRTMGDRILSRLADGLESSCYRWVALFELSYLGLTLLRSFRPLWYDELITYNVANLGGLKAMWQALLHGADLNPSSLLCCDAGRYGSFWGYGIRTAGPLHCGLRRVVLLPVSVCRQTRRRRLWSCRYDVSRRNRGIPVFLRSQGVRAGARVQWYRHRDVAKSCGGQPSHTAIGRPFGRAHCGASDSLLCGSAAGCVRDRATCGRLPATPVQPESLASPHDTVVCLRHVYPAAGRNKAIRGEQRGVSARRGRADRMLYLSPGPCSVPADHRICRGDDCQEPTRPASCP